MDMEEDLHGSAFHQGLNELQEVSGDDGEGILHEQLQVSHNLYEIGHSQTKAECDILSDWPLLLQSKPLLVLCDGKLHLPLII